jgi:hypothetical protein
MKTTIQKPADVKLGVVHSTANYAQFTLLGDNRAIDPQHVARLKQKIVNCDLLHAFPIVCKLDGDRLVVLDGQHRLRAAEELGRQIYYVVSPMMGECHIIPVNCSSRPWRLKDFARAFGDRPGNEDYQTTLDFAGKHGLNLSDAMNLLAYDGGIGGGGGAAASWKTGVFVITTRDLADKVVRALPTWRGDKKDIGWHRAFIIALARAVATGLYDHDHMEMQCRRGGVIKRCATAGEYLEEIERVYTRGARTRLTTFSRGGTILRPSPELLRELRQEELHRKAAS